MYKRIKLKLDIALVSKLRERFELKFDVKLELKTKICNLD